MIQKQLTGKTIKKVVERWDTLLVSFTDGSILKVIGQDYPSLECYLELSDLSLEDLFDLDLITLEEYEKKRLEKDREAAEKLRITELEQLACLKAKYEPNSSNPEFENIEPCMKDEETGDPIRVVIDTATIEQVIADAKKEVESWPPWKQNILEYSGQPNRPTPRPYVDNS